jgi:exonuclease SbcD
VRSFRTIELDLSATDNPQTKLLRALKPERLQDAVVRLIYHLRSDQLDQIDTAALQQALQPAHSYTIHAELVSQLTRSRLPELGVGNSIEPLEALQAYLANRADLRELEAEMLEAAQSLLAREDPPLFEIESLDWQAPPVPEAGDAQLRLL